VLERRLAITTLQSLIAFKKQTWHKPQELDDGVAVSPLFRF
jgi:hypothetical protein